MSRPARALWIEIVAGNIRVALQQRRGPRGPCGLKSGYTLPCAVGAGVEAREGLVD